MGSAKCQMMYDLLVYGQHTCMFGNSCVSVLAVDIYLVKRSSDQ